jgi:RNA polymerase sigma factor (sigma-70 family)
MSGDKSYERIWESFKQGDWNAYTTIYNDFYKLLNNYGYKFTRDVSVIEDAIQDLFVKLWNNKTSLGNPLSLKNYLFKSLRGILFRKIKSHSRFMILSGDDDYAFTFEISYDHQLIAEEEYRELQQTIQNALRELPARQQEIVYLRFYEGLSYEEIAEVMEIHINSVYKLWYKVLDSLQTSLKYASSGILLNFLSIYLSASSERHSSLC